MNPCGEVECERWVVGTSQDGVVGPAPLGWGWGHDIAGDKGGHIAGDKWGSTNIAGDKGEGNIVGDKEGHEHHPCGTPL